MLPDYKHYKKKQFLEELRNFLDINNPIEKNKDNNEISLKEITNNYVITPDNFLKMILILLRIRSNIPVIMMGERGCGKSSLIKILYKMKYNREIYRMKILNIHSGTTNKDIINFIDEQIIPESLFEETKIWVYLNEINACKSMGLISELICKHTCQGKSLPSNIVFIASCNPYRIRENKDNKFAFNNVQWQKQIKYLEENTLNDIKRKKINNLAYDVYPLPHSLFNYVFNFGDPNSIDEKKYIKNIIKDVINDIYYKGMRPIKKENNNDPIVKLKNLAIEMIILAKNYIREIEDKSTSSLREITNFKVLYAFFYDYLVKRKKIYIKEKENQFYKDNDFYN